MCGPSMQYGRGGCIGMTETAAKSEARKGFARQPKSGSFFDRWQPRERLRQLGLVVLKILQLAAEVVEVGLHVEVAVAAQIEQDGARLAFGLALQRFDNRALHLSL